MTEDFYKNIAGDVERWFDKLNYDENDKRLFQQVKTKKYTVFSKMNQEEKF